MNDYLAALQSEDAEFQARVASASAAYAEQVEHFRLHGGQVPVPAPFEVEEIGPDFSIVTRVGLAKWGGPVHASDCLSWDADTVTLVAIGTKELILD